MPQSFDAMTPPMSVYQVWQCTTCASSRSFAITSERANASMAPVKRGSLPVFVSSHCPKPRTTSAPSWIAWSPNERTSTWINFASARLRYSTCTPAPPYT